MPTLRLAWAVLTCAALLRRQLVMSGKTTRTEKNKCAPRTLTDVLLRELTALKEISELPPLLEKMSCIESRDTPLANDLFDLCAQIVLPRFERCCEDLEKTIRRVTLKRDQANRRGPTVVTVQQADALSQNNWQEEKDLETAVESSSISSLPLVIPTTESADTFRPAEVEKKLVSSASHDLKTTTEFNYSEINSIGIQPAEKPHAYSYDEVTCATHFIGRLSLSQIEATQLSDGYRPTQQPLHEGAANSANEPARPCERREETPVTITLEMHDKAIYIRGNRHNMKISLDP